MDQPPTITPDTQTRKRKIHCKQELIIQSLQRFYSGREDIDEIVEYLQGTSSISLRLIDWFVTNYAKTHNTAYILNNQEFVVYINYKNQLKAYSKKLFDPFCRRERILFQIPGHEAFLTTVGKLNFFRWAIEKGILDFIKGNQTVVEREMNTAMREQTKSRSTPSTRESDTSQASSDTFQSKRTESGESVISTLSTTLSSTRKRSSKGNDLTRSIQIHDCPIVIGFD
jgi:hypothetical protein